MCLAAAPALAQPAPARARLAVVAGKAAVDPVLAEATWWARAAAARLPGLSVIVTSSALGGDAPTPVLDGAKALEQGRAAFAELDLDRATERLSTAAKVLAGAGEGREQAVVALALLAEVRLAARDDPGAVEAFRKLRALAPAYAIDRATAAPSVLRAFEAAGATAAARTTSGAADVRIDCATAPAGVFLDGAFVGVTPVRLATLPTGMHQVELEADGWARASMSLDVRAGRRAALEVALQPARRTTLYQGIAQRLDTPQAEASAMDDLKALLFVDQSVILERQGTALAGRLYDFRSARVARALEEPLGGGPTGAREAAERLITRLYEGLDPRSPGTFAAAPNLPPERLEGGNAPIYDEWWFWAGVGLGAVVAVGVPLYLTLDEPARGLDRQADRGAVVLRF